MCKFVPAYYETIIKENRVLIMLNEESEKDWNEISIASEYVQFKSQNDQKSIDFNCYDYVLTRNAHEIESWTEYEMIDHKIYVSRIVERQVIYPKKIRRGLHFSFLQAQSTYSQKFIHGKVLIVIREDKNQDNVQCISQSFAYNGQWILSVFGSNYKKNDIDIMNSLLKLNQNITINMFVHETDLKVLDLYQFDYMIDFTFDDGSGIFLFDPNVPFRVTEDEIRLFEICDKKSPKVQFFNWLPRPNIYSLNIIIVDEFYMNNKKWYERVWKIISPCSKNITYVRYQESIMMNPSNFVVTLMTSQEFMAYNQSDYLVLTSKFMLKKCFGRNNIGALHLVNPNNSWRIFRSI